MGNELDEPILEKNSFDSKTQYIKFGLSSIQGWKTQMEDYNFYSTNIVPNSDKKIDIFGIFDGHNGPEVAKYISTNFLDVLLSSPSFKEGNYSESLKETFIKIDNSLNTEKVKQELIKISEEFRINEQQEILEIKKTCENGNKLNEKEIEQIKCVKNILNPRNLKNCNIASFSGCTAIVILITNNIIYIANAGNCRCIPIDKNFDVIKEKTNKLHLVNDEIEKIRIENSSNFKEKKFYPEFIETSRGFGDFEYKQNKWLKPEDQAISPEPEVIEINYEDCKYLIVGSQGFFDGNKDLKFFDKCNQDIADYFTEKIKTDKDKKFSEIIEEYFDFIVPKDKKDEDSDQSWMENITCFLIELLERPKVVIEVKKEEKKKVKIILEENKKEEGLKPKEFNKSMKNLFSFFTKMNPKNDKEEKKMESSASFSNIFKKKEK